VTSQPVTKLWASIWEDDFWEIYSAGNLLGERVALQVHAGRVVSYVEPPSDKALGESLLREYLLVEFLYERVARQVDAGIVALKALGELLGEVSAGRVAASSHWTICSRCRAAQ
jgi:hypothetical protein